MDTLNKIARNSRNGYVNFSTNLILKKFRIKRLCPLWLLCFLHSTLVLFFYIDIVLTISIAMALQFRFHLRFQRSPETNLAAILDIFKVERWFKFDYRVVIYVANYAKYRHYFDGNVIDYVAVCFCILWFCVANKCSPSLSLILSLISTINLFGRSLSGVPDLWDRTKILRCGDLSHIHVSDCIWVLFYFAWFLFIRHNIHFYFELCTYWNILDIYLL